MDTIMARSTRVERPRRTRWLLTVAAGFGLGTMLTPWVLFPSVLTASLVLAMGVVVGAAMGTRSSPMPAEGENPQSSLASPAACLEEWPELVFAATVFAESLRRLASQSDPILLDAAVVRLVAMQEEVRHLAEGRIVFAATEAWRTVYDQILRSPDIDSYRSVAWLRNEDYWQDVPGRRSMQTNFERLREGLQIERILILNDFFWPVAAPLPARVVCRWIEEQHRRGIGVGLVRESTLESEADLLCDFGIYGTRASGALELDLQCRTTRFTFDFSHEGVRLADERWKRLSLYAVAYATIRSPRTPVT